MSRFKLNGAKVGGSAGPSIKLPDGSYKLRVEKAFEKEGESKYGGTFVVVEFTVLEVHSGGEQVTDRYGNVFPATKEGDYRCWCLNMGNKGAMGDLNAFLAAVYGVDPRDPEALKAANKGKGIDFEKLYDTLIDTKNEMRGEVVEANVGLKVTGENKDGHFMAYAFQPGEE